MTLGRSATRSVAYLRGFRFLVIGDSMVAFTAAGVLTTLGGEVDRWESGLDGAPMHRGYDAIISDVVVSGYGETYADEVTRLMGDGDPSAPRVWVTASAFGLIGPARGFMGSDLVCAAAGGLLAAVFDDDGDQHAIPGNQALQTTGYLAALGALHGISITRQHGDSVHLDLSAQEAVAFCCNQQTPSHVLHKCGVARGHGRYSAPSGPFPCTDGQVQIIVVDNHQFARFAEAIERTEWIALFPNVVDRVQVAEMIDSVLAEWTSGRSKFECEEFLQSRGIAASAVRSVGEVQSSSLFQARKWPSRAPEEVVLPALVATDGVGPIGRGSTRRSVSDLHVLEVSNVLAGPLAGAILGAMGADVARVEATDRLDLYRQNGPFAGGVRGVDRAAYFQGANYCKRSVTDRVVQGESSDGARRWADVLIENVGAERVSQAGLGDGPSGSGKPSLSLSISAFGRAGASTVVRGYAQNVHAFAGLENAVVTVAGRPITLRTVLADYASAVWAATIVSAWWLGSPADEERIDLSMTEVVAARMALATGQQHGHGKCRPHDMVIEAGSRRMAVSVQSEKWTEAIIASLADTETAPDCGSEEYALQLLQAGAERDAEATVVRLQRNGIAAYLSCPPEDLVEDEQLASRYYFMRMAHPVIDEAYHMCLPWMAYRKIRSEWYRRAPLLGEDDDWAERTWRKA